MYTVTLCLISESYQKQIFETEQMVFSDLLILRFWMSENGIIGQSSDRPKVVDMQRVDS